MKTIHVKIILVLFLATVSVPTQARLADSADSTNYTFQGEKSFWQQMQESAEKKMAEIKSLIENKVAEYTNKPVAQEPARQVASATQEPPVPVSTETAHTASPAIAPTHAGKTEEQAQMAAILNKTADQVRAKDAITVAQPGRAGTSALPATKSGVPSFSLTQKSSKNDKSGKPKYITVTDIPRLDIGLERTIAKNDFIPVNDIVGAKKMSKAKELPSPSLTKEKEILDLKNRKWPVVTAAQKPKHDGIELGQLVSSQKIQAVSLEMLATKPLETLKPYTEISANDIDMIAAVILFEKGEYCHIVNGLLTDLANTKSYEEEANFYMGVCAHQMGFHSEAVSRLIRSIESEKDEFTSEAVGNLVENLPREYDIQVSRAIKGLKNKNYITDKHADNVNYVMARAAHAENDYNEAVSYAAKVSEKSKLYPQAQFLLAIGQYGAGKLKESEQTLLNLRTWLSRPGRADKNLEGLIALNLARMRFTQDRYQAANEEYLKVPKDQPMWVQALIEQGWTQLSIDDPEGAIGNMYSLHSPYFKSVFMPESWVVRTIGYIDICQYGDAYRTLTRLEQSHKSWMTALDTYTNVKKTPAEYYSTVKNYIKGKSDQNVDGLPSQIIREIARQREFLNKQNALNVLEDEIAQYQFIYGFVKRDQATIQTKLNRTKARLAKVTADIAQIKNNPELVKFTNEWNAQKRLEEQLVRSYEYQTKIFEKARIGYLKMKAQSIARIDSQKAKLRTEAGKDLMVHLKDVRKRMQQILEGNEFLRYEIFAGSGENIRYQVSGGATADARRIPANVKPQKILNWEFDGEYWEDEIGSYRSTLKNNCPKNIHTKTNAAGVDKTAQRE